jgi:hypothetical protein
VSPLSLLGNSSVNEYTHSNRRIVGCVVFYAIPIKGGFILRRTFCLVLFNLHNILLVGAGMTQSVQRRATGWTVEGSDLHSQKGRGSFSF